MQIRRCAIVMFEPYSDLELDFSLLLRGGAGITRTPRWRALAAHLDGPVVLDAEDVALLGRMDAERWIAPASLGEHSSRVPPLLEAGLVISDQDASVVHCVRDLAVREANWWPLAALTHRMGRWKGIDSVKDMHEAKLTTARELHARHGSPPPAVDAPVGTAAIALPVSSEDARDEVLARRVTCRNFDVDRSLPLELVAKVLKRTVKAHAVMRPGEDMEFLKKNIPSAGGLHPLETYVVAVDVDGLEPGIYHYHPVEHALRPVHVPDLDLRQALPTFLAGQQWFADAPLHLIQVARFPRNYWKYRKHPKAYRAVLLDAGHLSQQWMLSATELGLAAYVTAAINEIDVEAALGLDGIASSPVMMCGLGWRATDKVTSEFDPGERVWKQASSP